MTPDSSHLTPNQLELAIDGRTTVTPSANGKYNIVCTTRIGNVPMNQETVNYLLVSMIAASMREDLAAVSN